MASALGLIMIHEIAPHKLHNEFRVQSPKPSDFLVVFFGDKSLLKKNGDSFEIPRVEDFNQGNIPCHYLFSIDDTGFFLDDSAAAKTSGATPPAGYEYMGSRTFRSTASGRHAAPSSPLSW